jgi:hypothetical protein
MRGKKVKFEENEKHGQLTVIRPLNKSLRIGKRGIRRLWLFRCDCGNEVECFGSDVKNGRKQSCLTCYKHYQKNVGKRLGISNIKPNKEGPITKLFGTYKRQAIRRGYNWLLTKNDFISFLFDKCFYCGDEPKSEYTTSSNNPVKENILIYNGIDRKDNTMGYSKENCITACGICNRMKMDLDYKEFLEKIKKINKTLKL